MPWSSDVPGPVGIPGIAGTDGGSDEESVEVDVQEGADGGRRVHLTGGDRLDGEPVDVGHQCQRLVFRVGCLGDLAGALGAGDGVTQALPELGGRAVVDRGEFGVIDGPVQECQPDP